MITRIVHTVRCVAMFTYMVAGLAAFPAVLAAKMVADAGTEVNVAAFQPIAVRALQVAVAVAFLAGMVAA